VTHPSTLPPERERGRARAVERGVNMRRTKEGEPEICPFLHEVGNDVVCIYPQQVYCVGAEHGKPRFPSRATAQRYCAGNFEQCQGYQQRRGMRHED